MNTLISEYLRSVGFIDDEIPYFIDDLKIYFDNKNYSLDNLNYEMEELGWGYRTIDQELYDYLFSCFGSGNNSNFISRDS